MANSDKRTSLLPRQSNYISKKLQHKSLKGRHDIEPNGI
jgi:hypothetical protein